MLNIDGLASGLDTTSIIEGLLSIQQTQIDRFNAQKQKVVEQKTAFRSIEARLLTLKSTLSELTRPGGNAFLRKQLVSSDPARIEASVSNEAGEGIYSVRVDQLARNHQVASQVYNSADEAIATGTLAIGVGGRQATEIVVSQSNASLEGIATSINSTVEGVTATVIRQGGGHRLLLAADETGVSNQITFSFAPDEATPANPIIAIDLDNPVQAAENATIQLGTGSGALSFESETNQVDDLFPGITMNLLRATEGDEVTLTVSRDVQAAREAIIAFVDTYNETMEYISEQNKFDAESGEASLLFGNRALLAVRDRLSQTVSRAIALPAEAIAEGEAQPSSRLNRLAALGIRLGASGKLEVRSSQLDQVLNGKLNETSVKAEDLATLFGYSGNSGSEFIQFVAATEDTRPTGVVTNRSGEIENYEVIITNAARQAEATATNAVAETTIIDASNNQLDISIDGTQSSEIFLSEGTYTREELAEEIEIQLNRSKDFQASEVRVSVAQGKLKIKSLLFGLSSRVSEIGGSAAETLGFDGNEIGRGQDVGGKFSFERDGETVVEKATGSGRILTGDKGNEYSDGLRIRVTLNETQASVDSPFRTNLTVTRGIGEELDVAIDAMLRNDGDSKLGQISSATFEFDNRIASIDASIERLNSRFEAQQESLLRQFTNLESQISELQGIGNILSAQLASLPTINRR